MNDFFERVRAQAQQFWQNLTPSQRIWASVVSGVTLALLLGVIFFARQTTWVSIGTFDMQVSAQIKDTLEGAGYALGRDFKLSDDGRTIYADAQKRNVIHLALAEQGLFGQQEKGFAIFEEFDITTTDYEQRLRTLEALKSEMRRMIRSYQQVEDVTISVPFIEEQSIFIDKAKVQTASAVITLQPGATLDDAQILAIRRLISGGFSGLTEKNITLTDQYMYPLMPDEEDKFLSTKQIQVENETENELERKIREVLGRVLGADKFTVSANLDFDWDNIKINKIEYSTEGFDQLKRSEQLESEDLIGEGIRPGGEPGLASNSPPVFNGTTGVGPVEYHRNEQIVNYLADQTMTERLRAPYVKRLTAAVAVDGTWTEETGEEGNVVRTYVPRTDEEMADIRALVQTAIGSDLGRNDNVEVRQIKWDRTAEFKAADRRRAEAEFNRKVKIYSLLAAPLIVLLALLYMAWRRHVRIREEELARQRELERQRALASAESGIAGDISLEEQERQEIQRRASSLARAKPQVVAELLRTWLAEESPAA